MPELPEVETVRRGLAPILEGAVVEKVDIHRSGLRLPFPPDLAESLQGRTIIAVRRRAKYLLIELDNQKVLVSHLGMSGSWRVIREDDMAASSKKDLLEKHDHIVLYLKKVAVNKQLIKPSAEITDTEPQAGFFRVVYNDPRRFGYLLLLNQNEMASEAKFVKLGIEPLGNQLNGPFLQVAFKDKKTILKTILLNQNIIAGLGNIYVCEALWRAKLSPWRQAQDLAKASRKAKTESEDLAQATRSVLDDALKSGGSHLRNYRQADGSLGYFQHKFEVYGREGQACRRCGAKILRKVISGRSTFYCANCQK